MIVELLAKHRPHNSDNVRQAVQDMRIDYPVATDDDHAAWRAFGNHYWPTLYFADAQGRIRHHHYDRREYAQSEMVIQQLLAEAGSTSAGTGQVTGSQPARPTEPTPTAAARSPRSGSTSSSANPDPSPTARSRSPSSTQGAQVYCFTFGRDPEGPSRSTAAAPGIR
jgi:hypothetical protein